MVSPWSVYTEENIFISSDVKALKQSLLALEFQSFDLLSGSTYLELDFLLL